MPAFDLRDKEKWKKNFFEIYTPKVICEEVQELINFDSKNEFRGLVLDWFKEQKGQWKESEYQELIKEIFAEVSTALSQVSFDFFL